MKITLKVKDASAKTGHSYPVVELTREEWNGLSWGNVWEDLTSRFELASEVVDFRLGELP